MKAKITKLIFILSVCATNILWAQPNPSQRIGKRLDNELKVDGEKFQNRSQTPLRPNVQQMPQKPNASKPSINSGARNRPFYGNSTAEIFLRIPESYGYYTVIVGDQLVANDRGYYRFYEVGMGKQELLIYNQNQLIFATSININNPSRFLLDYYEYEGIYLLGSQPIQQYYNGYNNQYWNQMWDGYYGGNYQNNNNYNQDDYYSNPNYNNNPYNNGQGYYGGQVDDEVSFSQFLNSVKNTGFASTQVQMIKSKASSTLFTSSQIARIVDVLAFDSDKIEISKYLYGKCIDPKNYYIVADKLYFDSSKNKLFEYIQNYRI